MKFVSVIALIASASAMTVLKHEAFYGDKNTPCEYMRSPDKTHCVKVQTPCNDDPGVGADPPSC